MMVTDGRDEKNVFYFYTIYIYIRVIFTMQECVVVYKYIQRKAKQKKK